MSLSTVHFSSLLWNLRRLQRSWKWCFSQMSPEAPRVGKLCVLMLVSPVPCPGSVFCVSCTPRVLPERHLHRYLSETSLLNHVLINCWTTSEQAYFPAFLLYSSSSVWISESYYCVCAHCIVAMHLVMLFTGVIQWKQFETWEVDPLSLFCLHSGDGSPVHRAVCFNLK